MTQLAIPFAHRPALDAAAFMVSDSNREAMSWLDRWPGWASHALAIHGPEGSGKSHLARVWQKKAGAALVAARTLDGAAAAALAAGATAVEDADSGVDEAVLLHLYNLAREDGGFLLLTGRAPPARWRIALPDLASRLAAMPAVALGRPDDRLLAAVLAKQLRDRQLRVGAQVVAYLARRMERSFAAIARIVDSLDALSLAERRDIGISLARRVLDRSDGAGTRMGD